MQSTVPSHAHHDVYGAITQKIVAAIEAGATKFEMPWHRLDPGIGRPSNAQSRARYQGVNVVALWASAMIEGFTSGLWATYRQWDELGAQVRRGEQGTTIVFYQPRAEINDDTEEVVERYIARAFRVFNQDQVNGWVPPELAAVDRPCALNGADAFVMATKAAVRHGTGQACYMPTKDLIEIPDPRLFHDVTGYYSTLLHELTHWSGAEHRLDRDLSTRFGDEAYAMEELVAELGSAFLCADLEISNEPRPDHAAYLTSWLKVLKHDPRAIFTAAQKAREAATYLASFSEPSPAL